MKFLRKTAIAFLLFLQAALLLQLGCAGGPVGGGGNFAAPPAPIAEIPSFLQIPKDLSIDVGKTSGTGSSIMGFLSDPYLEAAFAKFLTAGACGDGTLNTGEQCDDGNNLDGDGCSATCQIENYSEQLTFSSNLVSFANERLNALLGPLSSFLIPVDATLQKMEAFIFIGSVSYIARLDFGDFDVDGVGGTEGCSGHTAALPICVRIWVDNGVQETRLFAARFDDFPLPENPGAGSLRGEDITFGAPAGVFRIQANYDHLDPSDKFTDTFFGGLLETPTLPTELFLPIRAFASQLGPDATALKTSSGNAKETTTLDQARQFGRWFEDKDFWLGSFEHYRGVPPSSQVLDQKFDNQCVHIPTRSGVDLKNCSSLGLDLTGLSFLPLPLLSDLTFFDFPPLAP